MDIKQKSCILVIYVNSDIQGTLVWYSEVRLETAPSNIKHRTQFTSDLFISLWSVITHRQLVRGSYF